MEVNGDQQLFGYQYSSKYLFVFSRRKSYRLETTWGWINDDRIFSFGWTLNAVLFVISVLLFFSIKKAAVNTFSKRRRRKRRLVQQQCMDMHSDHKKTLAAPCPIKVINAADQLSSCKQPCFDVDTVRKIKELLSWNTIKTFLLRKDGINVSL